MSYEEQFKAFIQKEMSQDLAHDFAHVMRVVSIAKKLCLQEQAKTEVVLPAAYLHDCFSHPKNHPERSQSSLIAANKAVKFLASINYPDEYLTEIHHAILAHSYSANVTPETIEAKIVQDADRLDALGAVGIARCIQVSSVFSTALYDIEDPFAKNRSLDDKQYAIDHFSVKLLKLVDSLNTQSAIEEGSRRTNYMRGFLNQLKGEI